jgi:hypothetical protein
LTPEIIAVIDYLLLDSIPGAAMVEANGAFRKAGAQPANASAVFESRSFLDWLKICQASLRLKGPFFAWLGAGLRLRDCKKALSHMLDSYWKKPTVWNLERAMGTSASFEGRSAPWP